jgi:hypothetical protein
MNLNKPPFALTHETISMRAYEIWQRQGAPDGQDVACWFQAEHELARHSGTSSTNIDGERIKEFLDRFGATASSRSATALNLT